MPLSRAAVFAVAMSALIHATPRAEDRADAGTALDKPQTVTRVFYLQGIEPREASTLLRSQVQVRRLAMVRGRDILIVADVAERVARSESLLRERDAIARSTDPHPPVNLDLAPESPITPRVFRVKGVDTADVIPILQAIYGMREVSAVADGSGVSGSAAPPVLDSAEALLRELGMLVEPAAPTLGKGDQRETYILKVEARGRGETSFSGWYAVNGKRIELKSQKTPFEFRCEAGETVAGAFRVDSPDRRLEVKVIDYGYSEHKAGPKARGSAIEFAWAQPGAGPRYVSLTEP